MDDVDDLDANEFRLNRVSLKNFGGHEDEVKTSGRLAVPYIASYFRE